MLVDLDSVLFDALGGASAPTEMFGSVLSSRGHKRTLPTVRSLAATARSQVLDTFETNVTPDHSGLLGLDHVIQQMWTEGWDPSTSNVQLFVRDFGLLLTDALLNLPHGQAVLRSTRVLDHLSVWFEHAGTEYFPFHKSQKAMTTPEGESLAQMFRSAENAGTGA